MSVSCSLFFRRRQPTCVSISETERKNRVTKVVLSLVAHKRLPETRKDEGGRRDFIVHSGVQRRNSTKNLSLKPFTVLVL